MTNGERGGLNAFLAETHRDLTVWGVASMCASTLLLLAYSCIPRVRRTPGWQFLYSSLCEIFVAGGFVVLSLVDDGSGRGLTDGEDERLSSTDGGGDDTTEGAASDDDEAAWEADEHGIRTERAAVGWRVVAAPEAQVVS